MVLEIMRLRFLYITFALLFVFNLTTLHGQNLVLNGGFEDFSDCPVKMSNLNNDVSYWNAPTLGTTDYFNVCSKTKLGIPMNFKGKQASHEGNGYAGLYLHAPKDYREYIQVPLQEPLQRGHRYQLTAYISLSEKSDGAVLDFGAAFSERPLSVHTKRHLSNVLLSSQETKTTRPKPFSAKGFYKEKQEWIAVELTLVAKGFESHLILGNFKSNSATKYLQQNTKTAKEEGYAYYYIDTVSLEYLGPEYRPNQSYVLDHVNFNFDRANLGNKAKENLRAVYGYLEKHPKLKVDISGHTDDQGSKEYNHVLSHRRAKAVVKYLVELGLDKNRITSKGYGNQKPLDSTQTEKARQKNRRVEFVMTQFEDN